MTDERSVQASAGPLVSGISGVDLTIGGGTGKFAGSSGTLMLEDDTRTDQTCLPPQPTQPVLQLERDRDPDRSHPAAVRRACAELDDRKDGSKSPTGLVATVADSP